MHDPMVVAFEIRRPWPGRRPTRVRPGQPRWEWTIHRRYGRDHRGPNPRRWWRPGSWSPFVTVAGWRFYFPSLITIWHVEPGGRDSGTVCRHWSDGGPDNRWRWHVHHWKIQIPPLQHLRAMLFDRCEVCHRKGRPNIGHQWDSPGVGWRKWRSRPDLYHRECSELVHLRRRMESRAEAIRGLMAFTVATTGRDEGRVLELVTATTQTPALDYHVSRELAQALGYESNNGRWRKAEPAAR